jgi:hypothetical protein
MENTPTVPAGDTTKHDENTPPVTSHESSAGAPPSSDPNPTEPSAPSSAEKQKQKQEGDEGDDESDFDELDGMYCLYLLVFAANNMTQRSWTTFPNPSLQNPANQNPKRLRNRRMTPTPTPNLARQRTMSS